MQILLRKLFGEERPFRLCEEANAYWFVQGPLNADEAGRATLAGMVFRCCDL